MTSQPNRKGGRHVAKKEPNYRRRMIIMIVLAVIMVLAATVCVLVRTWVVKPTLPPAVESPSPEPTVNAAPESQDPAVSPTPNLPEYDPVQPKVSGERKSKDFYTILVFGTDETSGLTDTMMVVSYDVTNQKASVMSLPRDTLINIKRSYKKLNGVYNWYGGGQDGINALKSEVSELIGFVPDYYVKIEWEIVGRMVDAIGGVWFDVPEDMWYSDPYQDLYIDLKGGYQLLNGDQAMQLVRWRGNMDPVTFKVSKISDIKRLEIQHSFLKSVLSQVLRLKNVTRISELAEVFGENVVSDLSIENMFWFGSQAIMGGLSVDAVQFSTMPWISGNDYNGTSYVFPNWNKLLTIINDQLNPFAQKVTMKQLDLMEVRNDGTLASSTGVLADPAMGVLPVEETPEPSDNPDPDNSRNPIVDQPPGGSSNDDPKPSATPGVSTDPTPAPTPDPTPAPTTDPEPEPSDDGGGLEWPGEGGIWDNPI